MIKYTDTILDCPDPMALAAFYAAVIGTDVEERSDDFWASINLGGIALAFQRVDDYVPPTWPGSETPKQFHLDFEVDEFGPERERIVALGATLQKSYIHDDGYGWEVFTDPVGHPFCLCRNKGFVWE
ncbi:MAG: VOC family protein [Mycobacteriaceae bacterium]